jgi:hypothetical protein
MSSATATNKPLLEGIGKGGAARIQYGAGASAVQRASANVELVGPQRSHSLEPGMKGTALGSAGAAIIGQPSAVSNTLLVSILYISYS